MRTVLLVLGSILPIVASFSYIGSIIKGKTKPQRMTRFLLVVITIIMTLSLWAGDDTSGVWLALASFIEAFLIWILSFKQGMGGRGRFDYVCLGLCIGGIVLWQATSSPWLGLVASILADMVGCLPALVKTVRLPHTEQALFYLLGSLSGFAILLAGPFTFRAMIFPAYIMIIDFAFVVAIRWPRENKSRAPQTEL